MHDVVVVGGGPVGSYVACKLAGMGYGVVVLEQREGVGGKPCCTGIVSHECADSFTVDEDVILRRANSARFFSPTGNNLRLHRQQTQAYIVDRPAFDRFWAEKARCKGAEFKLDNRAENIDVQHDKIIVDTINGKRDYIEARTAVIATGFGSPLLKRLGLGRVTNSGPGAQAEVETVGVDEVEVYFGHRMAPGFFAWLVPTSPGKGLAGLFSRQSPGIYLKKFLAYLTAQGKIVSDEVEIRHGAVPLRPLSRTFSDRLLVVGDAAGQVKPTTGGGIYFGLLCADLAAGTLDNALKTDNLSAGALSGYERAWRKKLGRELAADYYARLFYEHLNDKQIDRLFGIIKSDGIADSFLESGLSFDWHGQAVLKVLKHRAIAKAVELMKLPFSLVGM